MREEKKKKILSLVPKHSATLNQLRDPHWMLLGGWPLSPDGKQQLLRPPDPLFSPSAYTHNTQLSMYQCYNNVYGTFSLHKIWVFQT